MHISSTRAYLSHVAMKDTCFLFAPDRSSQFANRGEIYRCERDLIFDSRSRNKWRRRVAWNIRPICDAMCPR